MRSPAQRRTLLASAAVFLLAAASANWLIFADDGSANTIGQISKGTSVDQALADLGATCAPQAELDDSVGASYLLWHRGAGFQLVVIEDDDQRSTGAYVSVPGAFATNLCQSGVPDDPTLDTARWRPAS